MVRGKGTPKEILAQSEVETLRDEQREIETTIKEASAANGSTRGGAVDVNRLRAKSQYIDKAIEERSAREVRGKEKDKLFSEEREIEDRISRGIPTTYEMDRPAKNPGAVDKHLNWLKRNDADIRRYAEIQKLKGPNEERKYIDQLRKEK